MPHGERLLDRLAHAVLDGVAVDWAATESGADETARPLLRELRLVASVAELHRSLQPPMSAVSAPVIHTAAPAEWGHLHLLEPIGHGTFGEVFRAWDSRLDREVALKLIPATSPAGALSEPTIIREGRLLAKVRHPNVVTIYGAEQIGDWIGLWMEFVRGRTLEQLLQDGQHFGTAEIVHTGVEICRAVAAVHAAGLLHRDIKAHNVVQADDGRIVLMDFGAGTELDGSDSPDIAGTPLYAAPEILSGQPATVRSDIYSLGILLYHLASAAYPVTGRSMADVRQAHERGDRVPLRSVRPDVPPRLARVIDRACDPQPGARYENADALARELSRLGHPWRIIHAPAYVAAAAVILVAIPLLSELRTRDGGGSATPAGPSEACARASSVLSSDPTSSSAPSRTSAIPTTDCSSTCSASA